MKLRFASLLALPLAVACSSGNDHAAHADHAPAAAAQPAKAEKAEAPKVARPDENGMVLISATRDGFVPSQIEVEGGKPVKLVFLREVEKSCMTAVVFPGLEIEKELPVGEKVEIEVTPEAGGSIAFQCPMGMGKSTVVGLPKA